MLTIIKKEMESGYEYYFGDERGSYTMLVEPYGSSTVSKGQEETVICAFDAFYGLMQMKGSLPSVEDIKKACRERQFGSQGFNIMISRGDLA